jgi:hypothetical protein
MTNREWLADQIREDARAASRGDEPEAPWLDGILTAVLAESGLSDRSIALLLEAAADPGFSGGEQHAQVLVDTPPIALRRQSLGVSTTDAAARLGVGRATYEVMEEQAPLRWLNVDSGRVAAYLGLLGIPATAFVRWLASRQPGGPQVAWGYRPGITADRPVETGDAAREREDLVVWGRALLAAERAVPVPAAGRELFGHRWSDAVAGAQSLRIAEAAIERILMAPMLSDLGRGVDAAGLIALPTDEGTVYPAFQFDDLGVPIPVVVEINGVLGASEDPWGVADWWLAVDADLGASPADLARGDVEAAARLRAAAQTLLGPE